MIKKLLIMLVPLGFLGCATTIDKCANMGYEPNSAEMEVCQAELKLEKEKAYTRTGGTNPDSVASFPAPNF